MNFKKNPTPHYWAEAKIHLINTDPILAKIINNIKTDAHLTCKFTGFQTFFKIIIGQQISIEAANSIEKRIKQNIKSITPKSLINTNDSDLRRFGLSYRKIKYIKGIADLYLNNSKFFGQINKLTDKDAVNKLSSLYGIGMWSAEMFLIFHHNRQNILPTGDIGLINSYCKNYNVNKEEFLENILEHKKLWNPYCTVATWFLWRDIDEDTVQY